MMVQKEKKAKSKRNTIFVQIAAYRDPQLVPTLDDMFKNAKFPNNLRIGICWQHNKEDEWDSLGKYADHKQVKVIDVDYSESKGVCWARNLVQQLYDGEKYTLQLDSHHRFAENWDQELIKMIKQLQKDGHKKPLLTAYIPSFDPEDDPASRIHQAWKMNFDRFIPEGAIFFLPANFSPNDDHSKPLPSRFYSAHFCFTLGSFVEEVPHDPNYYFHGEEISIAVRAFTHGYDLFHPNKPVCWHEYTRKGRTKQWDDDKVWHDRNMASHLRNRKLFEMDGELRDIDFGKYDFGKVRTLRDYEKYAGISFKKRGVHRCVLDHEPPPNSEILAMSDEEFDKNLLSVFKHCIDIQYSQVPENDYDFWVVAFKDAEGNDLYRKDADVEEIQRMKTDQDGYCKIWREFQTDKKPASWLVWPHSLTKEWMDPITGAL